jgi:hypothetical protein
MKKILSMVFVLALVVSLGAMTRAPTSVESSEFGGDPIIINVPDDYPTIQEAVDAAGPGYMIRVAAGEYGGFVVLDKQDIRIVGAEGTTVTGANITSINREIIEDAWSMAAVKDSQNVHIEGVAFDGAGITGQDSVVGIAYVDSTGDIRDLTVENMVGTIVGVGVAIIGTGTVGVTGTRIIGNMVGLYFLDNPVVKAHHNSIEDNTVFGALNQGTTPVDAAYNYWGSEWGPFHPEDNPTGGGNPVSDNVDFKPWASGPRLVYTVTGTGSYDIDARAAADTVVRIEVLDPASGLIQATSDNDGEPVTEVTIAVLDSNPDTDATPPSNWQSLEMYIQVGVVSTGKVSSARIELYYGSNRATQGQRFYELLWLDDSSSQWKRVVGETGVQPLDEPDDRGYHGYIYVVLTDTTTPDLAYLNDGDWGGYAGPTPIPGFCFIATAAYGTHTAQELDILREFRDTVLLPNRLGAGFVSIYYRNSPPVAGLISRHEPLRTAVRLFLVDPVVNILNRTYEAWSRSDW